MQESTTIEQSLLLEKLISAEQLQTVRLEQQRSATSLVNALRKLRFIKEEALIDFLAEKLNLIKFSLSDFPIQKDLLALVPPNFLWNKHLVPLFKNNDELAVGVLDPLDMAALDEMRFRTGLFVKPYLVKEDELAVVLTKHCDRRKYAPAQDAPAKATDQGRIEASRAPGIVDAVNLLLLQALRVNASDVHIEPHEEKMTLRIRVDGVLKEITPPEAESYNAFISRIKIMANLDIAEKRLPQDGRFKADLDEYSLDVRVSVIPTIQGESIVMRLLRQNKKVLTLDELGYTRENREKFAHMIQKPQGIILVTGPTGSGKTTTLYAALQTLKNVEKNIITIEDPVEYQLDFSRQIQVNTKVNLSFAAGLRSVLRHDPDIIMVGEIRDLETATIAIQAALTGHLVISTLHTNDSVSAITRLVDMGIEPFLIASCLNGVVAQRLVRLLCPKCKKALDNMVFQRSAAPAREINIYQPQGCQECLNTGFKGRIAIFEIMDMEPEIGRLTVAKASSEEIGAFCKKKGMKFLYDDGWDKVARGLTSPQELMRVLGAEQ